MTRMLVALLLLLGMPGPAAAQSLAFTFDDGFDPRVQPQAAAWNRAILDALGAAGLHAMLFPAGKNVDSDAGRELVAQWSRAGHAVGNHTYAHRSLGSPRVPLEDFEADVLRQERLFAGLPGWRRRLRFPYLKEGDSAAKRDGMRAWMAGHGYRPAAVSIDTSDWYYNERFLALPAGDRASAEVLRRAYLQHILGRVGYYESLAGQVLGRSPAHVMLLHTNALNAAFLGDLIGMLRARGWTLVDAEQAYADPLYERVPRTLPAGESLLWALAREAGVAGLRYPAEDDVYEKPLLDAAGL